MFSQGNVFILYRGTPCPYVCFIRPALRSAPDKADRLFGRFYWGAEANDATRSGRLGLSIVQALTRSYEGTVSAQSDGRGTGSTFEVQLPTAGAR
jgi:signal transduction histidine kinase